jgi:membrane protein YqaA with SNARE-associated domain
MEKHATMANNFNFPTVEQMMYGAVVGTIVGLIIGLWLKSYVDRKSLEEKHRLQKLPSATMTWYKKAGPLTAIWRMLGV